ncbi:TonB-dependent receptor [Pseudoxanthomonas broegbernensis]|uniref:TonB-dependent receptor n=1 Tax=Pseudoxanthomonas broegbernensis TaxID=83619 RepID=A0A7V8GPX0_9GAMM|nr:TonB-dependent receptor [Pseudoxanthomonas broegbernensis]KAF1687967.1 TonB-dependent receptor [Pseudoxanthomonas broegbernensis]MBB6064979.1 outer membrane receptor for ferrienterochelin and colicins [Pseudoxanthomonas broegbernensis]
MRGALFLLAFCTCAAVAREPSATDLERVVVTATRTEQNLDDAPASISVITREELRQRPVQDLSDALRGTPGVVLSGIGLTRRGVRVRGMDSEYTLTLVDGRRINAASDAIAHADFDLGWIPAEAIERIEVVRGPMSSLYGSEALGGVVNVITRRATDDWRGSATWNGGSVAGGRGGNTYQGAFYAGGPLVENQLGLSFYGETRHKGDIADPADERVSEQEGRDSHSGNLVLTWTPGEAQRIDFSHLQGKDKRWRNALQAGGAPYVYETIDDVERRQTSLTHRGQWRWGESVARAYRSTLDRENRRSRGDATRPQSLLEDIVDGHLSVPLGDRHRVTVGGEWRQEQLDDNTVAASGHAETIQRAVFAQDEIDLTEAWSLVLGSRADLHEKFGWHHSPRAYSVYHVNDRLLIKGGVGSGFKAPSLKQLSPEYSAVGGGGRFTIYGNPDLKPETVTTYELAAGWRQGAWQLEAALFRNDLEDLVQTLCVARCGIRGAEVRNYINVAEARIQGLEISAKAEFSAGFVLDANYSWLDPEDRSTGLPLAERSRHSGAARLGWNGTNLRAGLRGEYHGTQWQTSGMTQVKLPAYALWSLDLGYRITDRVRLRASVENLADERPTEHSALYAYAETGRYFNVGIDLGF